MLKDTLKLLREQKNLTKKQVADAIEVTERAYITYEYGQRDVSTGTLQKLADFYGVTTDYLLGRPDAKAPADLIKAVAAERQLTSAQQGILAAYLYMDSGDREKLVEYIRQFAAAAEKADAPEDRATMTCGEVEDFREA